MLWLPRRLLGGRGGSKKFRRKSRRGKTLALLQDPGSRLKKQSRSHCMSTSESFYGEEVVIVSSTSSPPCSPFFTQPLPPVYFFLPCPHLLLLPSVLLSSQPVTMARFKHTKIRPVCTAAVSVWFRRERSCILASFFVQSKTNPPVNDSLK